MNEKIKDYIDKNLSGSLENYDLEILGTCLQIEMLDVFCGVKAEEIDKKPVFNIEKFNEAEPEIKSYLHCMVQYFKVNGHQLTTGALLFLMHFVSYLPDCAFLSSFTCYEADKRGFDEIISLNDICMIFHSGMPDKRFKSGFWEIVKEHEQ